MEKLHEASFWEKEKDLVHCKLCYRDCRIPINGFGNCGIRQNVGGRLYALTYGKACAVEVDPIEKKPFYHYYPGEPAFSISTVGCNYHCLHCCNPSISQARVDDVPFTELPSEKVVQSAIDSECGIIAYTYTEPTVFYEYAHDSGVIARKKGLKNVFVTNGYAQNAVIKNAAKDFLDAARIDLKGDAKHYLDVCGGVDVEKVLKCIKDYHDTGMHIELITLVIPKDNDKKEWVAEMADFLKGLGRDGKNLPWHFIQFFPSYKMMDTPNTPVKTLESMHDWARDEGMNYVYTGNVRHDYDSTYCHNCGELLIKRSNMLVVKNILGKDAKCPACRAKIPIVLG